LCWLVDKRICYEVYTCSSVGSFILKPVVQQVSKLAFTVELRSCARCAKSPWEAGLLYCGVASFPHSRAAAAGKERSTVRRLRGRSQSYRSRTTGTCSVGAEPVPSLGVLCFRSYSGGSGERLAAFIVRAKKTKTKTETKTKTKRTRRCPQASRPGLEPRVETMM
jgi:hypothetical protein